MVAGFKNWRVYVEGAQHPVQVYTDHKNLEYFSTSRTTSRRHSRWAASLANYDFKIIYCKGTLNGKADAISRRPDYKSPLPLPLCHNPPPLPSSLHPLQITLLSLLTELLPYSSRQTIPSSLKSLKPNLQMPPSLLSF